MPLPLLVLLDAAPWHIYPGYGWLFPGEAGQANVGIGVGMGTHRQAASLRADLARFCTLLRGTGDLAAGAQPGAVTGGWLRMGGTGTPPAARNVLLAGDAAGLINPLQGEGIGPAMLSARLAAECLLAGAPDAAAAAYTEAVRDTFGRYLPGAAALQAALLRRPRLASGAVRLLDRPRGEPAGRRDLVAVLERAGGRGQPAARRVGRGRRAAGGFAAGPALARGRPARGGAGAGRVAAAQEFTPRGDARPSGADWLVTRWPRGESALATAAVRGGAAGGAQARAGAAQPGRAPLVLTALILVAAVANLNLTVANVVLPDIGRAFDAGQTTLDLIAIGYSLGLAGSVLYLGAVGDRYGRKLLLVCGVAAVRAQPACWPPTRRTRGPGGCAAARRGVRGHGLPHHAGPDHRAVVRPSPDPGHRAVVRHRRCHHRARARCWPAWLLQYFWWGSAFLLTLPLAVVALVLAVRSVPAHVNETTGRVDHLGGVLSMVFVAALVITINFAPVPGSATLALSTGLLALAAGAGFLVRQRRAHPPLYDLHVAGRRIFWVAAVGGIIVFGSLMGAIFVGQQYLQDVLGYSALRSGLAVLPAAVCLVAFAPLSARLVHARGSGWTLLSGYLCCLLSFLTMLLLWHEGTGYWAVGPGLRVPRHRRRAGRHPGVALAHRLGARPPGRHGVGHRRPATRPGRRDHAVGTSARCSPPGTRARWPGRSRTRRTASRSPAACRTSWRSPSRVRRRSPSVTRSTPARSPQQRRVPSWPGTSGRTPAAIAAVLLGAGLVFFLFPPGGRRTAAGQLPRRGQRGRGCG